MCYSAKAYPVLGGRGTIFGVFPFVCVWKFSLNKEGIKTLIY